MVLLNGSYATIKYSLCNLLAKTTTRPHASIGNEVSHMLQFGKASLTFGHMSYVSSPRTPPRPGSADLFSDEVLIPETPQSPPPKRARQTISPPTRHTGIREMPTLIPIHNIEEMLPAEEEELVDEAEVVPMEEIRSTQPFEPVEASPSSFVIVTPHHGPVDGLWGQWQLSAIANNRTLQWIEGTYGARLVDVTPELPYPHVEKAALQIALEKKGTRLPDDSMQLAALHSLLNDSVLNMREAVFASIMSAVVTECDLYPFKFLGRLLPVDVSDAIAILGRGTFATTFSGSMLSDEGSPHKVAIRISEKSNNLKRKEDEKGAHEKDLPSDFKSNAICASWIAIYLNKMITLMTISPPPMVKVHMVRCRDFMDGEDEYCTTVLVMEQLLMPVYRYIECVLKNLTISPRSTTRSGFARDAPPTTIRLGTSRSFAQKEFLLKDVIEKCIYALRSFHRLGARHGDATLANIGVSKLDGEMAHHVFLFDYDKASIDISELHAAAQQENLPADDKARIQNIIDSSGVASDVANVTSEEFAWTLRGEGGFQQRLKRFLEIEFVDRNLTQNIVTFKHYANIEWADNSRLTNVNHLIVYKNHKQVIVKILQSAGMEVTETFREHARGWSIAPIHSAKISIDEAQAGQPVVLRLKVSDTKGRMEFVRWELECHESDSSKWDLAIFLMSVTNMILRNQNWTEPSSTVKQAVARQDPNVPAGNENDVLCWGIFEHVCETAVATSIK